MKATIIWHPSKREGIVLTDRNDIKRATRKGFCPIEPVSALADDWAETLEYEDINPSDCPTQEIEIA